MRNLSLSVALVLLISIGVSAKEKPAPPPATKADIAYGPHERHTLDLWQAESPTPTPVFVLIHGGGWIHGDKERMATQSRNLIVKLLQQGISVASINYRYSPIEPLPAPVHDAARAIQYLRLHAKELNIDPARFAATGGSAGGCTTLWLAAHDDLADPDAEDPVLRQSTRLVGAIASVPQTTLEPQVIREKVIPDALKHAMIRLAGGYKSIEALEADWENAGPLYKEFSPVNHVSKDDPPVLIRCSGQLNSEKDGIHHSKFGLLYKNRADEVGAICHLALRGNDAKLYPKPPDTIPYLLDVFGMTPANP